MKPTEEAKILSNLAGAWMLVNGQDLPAAAIPMLMRALSPYKPEDILKAIERCVTGGRSRISLPDIIGAIQSCDVRPDADEAWSIAHQSAQDEEDTYVITEDINQALCGLESLIEMGDMFNASRAFKAKYTRIVEDARASGLPVKWFPSLGYNKDRREQALIAARDDGKLAPDYVAKLLPYHSGDTGPIVAAIAGNVAKMIGTDKPLAAVTDAQHASQRLRDLIASVAKSPEPVKQKPSAENSVRIVNEAIEMGVIRDLKEIDHWMTLARNREDVSGLQLLMLEKRNG